MKKLYSILLASMILCVACQWKLKPEDEDQQAPLMEVERYDRLEFRYLTTGDFSAIQYSCPVPDTAAFARTYTQWLPFGTNG